MVLSLLNDTTTEYILDKTLKDYNSSYTCFPASP